VLARDPSWVRDDAHRAGRAPIIGRGVAPDGSELRIRWIPCHDRWEVKRSAGPGWFESRRLALAIAAATGYRYSPDAPWIRELENEIRGDQPGQAKPTNAPKSS
jgi:hypothetical protein